MKNFKLFEKCNRRIARRVTLIAVLLAMCMPQAWAWTAIYFHGDFTGEWDGANYQINYELEESNSGHYFYPFYNGSTGDKYWRLYAQKSYVNYQLSPSSNNYIQNVGTVGYKVTNYKDWKNYNFKTTNASKGVLAVHINQGDGNGDLTPGAWLEKPTIYIWHNWSGNTSNWGNNGGSGQKAMTNNNDGTYSYDGVYSASGTNVGIEGSGAIKKYIADDAGSCTKLGSPTSGDKCRFTWNAEGYKGYDNENTNTGSLTIAKLLTITYNANSPTSGTAPSVQEVPYGSNATLSTNTGNLDKSGYVFNGWNTAANGSGDHYDEGATIENVTAGMTLYAEWSDATWGIKGGEGDKDEGAGADHDALGNWITFNQLKKEGSTAIYSAKITLPARHTYCFKVFNRAGDDYYGYGSSGYQITFIGQTGYFNIYNGTQENLRLMTAGAGEYEFVWDSENKKVKVLFPEVNHPSMDYVYFTNPSNWATVVAHLWGDVSSTGWNNLPTVSYDGSTYYYTPVGSSTGGLFGEDGGDKGPQNQTSDFTTSGHYGQSFAGGDSWSAFSVTINLDNQGADVGHEGDESKTVDLGYEVIAEAEDNIDIPDKTGYNFGGYYTAKNGGGLQIINASGEWQAGKIGYTDASGNWIKDGMTNTLYAKWTEKEWDVTAVASPSSGGLAIPNEATSYGQITGGAIRASEYEGYDFSKWVVSSGAGTIGSATTASTTFKPTAASTVKAIFCPEEGSGLPVYKFQTLSSGLGNDAICANKDQNYDLTDKLDTLIGGFLKARASSAGTTNLVYNTNSIRFTGGNSGWLILGLDCHIQEGDVIRYRYVNSTAYDISVQTKKGTPTNQITLTGNSTTEIQTVTLTEAQVSAFSSLDTVYLVRTGGGTCDLDYFEILRPYTVTLDAATNGGKVNSKDEDAVIAATPTYLPRATQSGYQFLGWSTAADGDPVAEPYTPTSNITLYAIYDACPSSGTIFSLSSVTSSVAKKVPACSDASKPNYMDLRPYATIVGGAAYSGNNHTSNEKGGVTNSNQINIDGENAFVRVDLDCALEEGDKISVSAGQDLHVTTSYPRATTYTITKSTDFVCPAAFEDATSVYIWKKSSNTQITGITITRPAPVSTFDVTIASNNDDYGYVDVESIDDVTSGTEISASDNVLTIGATEIIATPETSDAQYTYTFTGWTDDEGEDLPSTVTADLAVRANFTRTLNTYTVTWKNYDGTTLETDAAVEYGDTPTYNGSTPTKASTAEYSYTFDAWDPAVTSVTEAATYTATFTETARNYTLAWDKNGDGDDLSGSYTSGTTAYGTTLTAPNTPTWDGHRFDGWNTKANGSGDAYTGTMPAADTKYYAQWTVLHDVTITATNVTKSTGVATAAEGEDYVATFSTVTGYDLPTSVAVKIGDDDAVLTTDYTWSAGTLTVLAASVTDDITITVIGDPQTYTISYKDKDGDAYSGSNLALLPTSHTYGSSTALVNGVRTGYIFNGWYGNSACDGAAMTSVGATAFSVDFTLYAKWTAKTAPTQYAVTIDASTVCSGSTTNIKMAASQSGVSYQLYKGEEKVSGAKEGGSALTWSSISATGTYKVMAVENATYASRDMSNTVILANYDAVDIATQPTASVDAAIGSPCSLSGLTLVDGTFNNAEYQWQTCTDAEGTGAADITTGSAYADYNTATLSFTPAGEGTYYFRCVVSDDCGNSVNSDVVTVTASDMYVITYNANGGTGTMANTTGNGSVTLRTNTFTRTGYKFMGWAESSTDANLGKIYYADAATITLDASVTLYAVWAKRIYYYKDATHYDGETYTNPEGTEAESGDNTNLTSPWTICEACATGVSKVKVINGQYDGKGTYMNAYIKLAAGGNKDSKNITFTLTEDYIATLKIKIGGYSSNPTVTVCPLISGALGDPIAYTGEVTGVATTEDNFGELTYSLNIPGGTYVLTVSGPNAYVSEITMLGTWCYATTLNKNNSDVGSEDGSAYIAPFGKKLLGLTAPTRTGYAVQGYFADNDYTTQVADAEGNLKANVSYYGAAWTNAEGEWILSGGRTLYAKWGASRTLTYDANGATGTAPSAHDYVVGTTVTVSDKNTLTKAGYTFIGWNSAADGSGIFYAEGTNFRMPAENLTLYAQWYGKELANIDFRESKWTGETFSQGNTDTYDVKYGLTFNSKDGSKSFSLANNTTDGLTLPNNNMSSSNYFFGIPLSNINGSITIIIKHAYSSNKAAFRYKFVDGATAFSNSLGSSGTQVKDVSSSDTEIVFSVDASNVNHKGYLYIGRDGSDYTKILGIQVVTPGEFSGKAVTFANMTGFTGETTLPDEIDVPSGSKIIQPVNPKAAKWVFAGWYGDATCTEGNEMDWSMSITADKTIYAKWIDVTGKYTFHYGTGDPTDNSTWEIVPFTAMEGSSSGYEVKDFIIPNIVSYPEYFVGYEGEFVASDLGTGDYKSKSVVSPWDSKMKIAYREPVTGIGKGQLLMSGDKKAEGAKGSLIMASYYSSDNLYVGFEPNEFGLDWRSSTTELHATPNSKIYETDVVTLTADDIADTYKVRLATSDSYAESGQSTEEDVDDLELRKIDGETYDIAAGTEGRFQILLNSDANNFGLRFVPLKNRSFGSYSINWTDDDKWTLGRRPNIDEDAYINNSVNVNVADATANKVIISKYGTHSTGYGTSDNDGRLYIKPQGGLLIAEDLTVQTDEDVFVSNSEAYDLQIETSSEGNGALIMGSASTTTEGYYHFYSKAKSDAMYESTWVNQYIGIPFTTVSMYEYYATYLYAYSHTMVDAKNKVQWLSVVTNNMKTLNGFQAYCILREEPEAGTCYLRGTFDFPGNEAGNKVLSYEPEKVGGNITGDYLFANSWTAPIYISALVPSDFVGFDQTIYIFNAGSKSDVTTHAGEADAPGQWTTIPINEASETTVIPSTQAFALRIANPESATHTFTLNYKTDVYDPAYAAVVTNKGNMQTTATRAPKRQKVGGEYETLRIHVQSESGYADNVRMLIRDDFTSGFDNGWDGHKKVGISEAPQIYAENEVGRMAVSAEPELEGKVIGFKAGSVEDTYTISFDYDEKAETLYLLDTDLDVYTPVTREDTYTFTTVDKSRHPRFVLTYNKAPQTATGVDNVQGASNDTKVRKVLINDHIYIIRGGRMYDATGKKIK